MSDRPGPRYSEIPTLQCRGEFDAAVRALREGILTLRTEESIERFVALSEELKARTVPIRNRLLETGLDWTDEERALGGWSHAAHQRMGNLGRKLVTVATKRTPDLDATIVRVIALSLQHIGNGVKSELANGPVAARDYREMHALMKEALALDCAKAKVALTVQGRTMPVAVEALYFRALILARFAQGGLTTPQMEILDWWIWQWRELLQAVSEAPGPRALRADVDSTGGLRQGPRPDGLPALYLPIEPIAEAYRSIVADFHAGRLDRGASVASSLPVAEHVAVLDALRRSLARVERDVVPRQDRRPAQGEVEVLVDLAEIVAKGFPAAAVRSMGSPAAQRDRHDAFDEVYAPARRTLALRDASDSGFGLEGSAADCRGIAIGTLLAVRTSAERPPVVCRVMRRLHDGATDRVTLGTLSITAAAQPLPVRMESSRGTRPETLLFVPGSDSSGARDAFLVPDSLLREPLRFEAALDDGTYAFRLNRVCRKGRGWSLAGFEVVAVRA